MGDSEGVCAVSAGAFKNVLIENVSFGSVEGKPVIIGGSYRSNKAKSQPAITQSVVFKNVKAHSLRSARLNAGLLRLENVDVSDGNFKEGRLERLEFDNAKFASTLDLSGTKAKEFKQSGGTDLRQLGSGLKLEGSNIKLPG